ncbi:MAG: hypothetical protein NVS3B25_31580 [Hymenobacter sp.]
MKPTLLLLCLFAALARPVFAQMQPVAPTEAELRAAGTESPRPFKDANTILVHAPDSVGVALRKLARSLVMAGIEPDRIDAQVGYLTTKGKAVGALAPAVYQYKVLATPEPGGTMLAITGDYTKRVSLLQSVTVAMFWRSGGLLESKQCFALVEAAAATYPKGRLGYKYQAAPAPVFH